jgi:N-acetylglucosaminyl-diphospho-decaprenol L-rhamnosyltransferase
MKNLKNLTAVIVTYRTPRKIITNCVKSINKNVKILIIENSKKFDHKNYFKKKFPKVKIICSGDNLGYGKGNNLGLKLTRTNYALILNPDIKCGNKFFVNLSKILDKKINFDIIGCQYLKDKVFMPAGYFDPMLNFEFKKKFNKNKVDTLIKVDWITGCSMVINLKKFKKKDIFDKNFFLYFEEFDLCKSILKKGGNIYSAKDLKVHHLGFASSLGKTLKDKINANNIREWHWMWSSFYYYKKHYTYLHAICKFTTKLIKSFIKIIFFSIFFQKEKKNKYLYRFLGLMNSFLNKPSFFRGVN